MCEKQIVVPNTSILYCSERFVRALIYLTAPTSAHTSLSSCRRRDSIPNASPINPFPTSSFHGINHSDHIMRDYLSASLPDPLPRLQPTAVTGIKEARIPPRYHEGASDLDPTEWKPAEPGADGERSPLKTGFSTPTLDSGPASASGCSSASLASSWKLKLVHRPSSTASAYLGQFHRSSVSLSSTKRRSARAKNGFSTRATPGLSHSPTVSSAGSEESMISTPNELVIRPRAVSRATTVVTKALSEQMGVEMTYEKQNVPAVINPSLRSASGCLKELLTGGKKADIAM